MDKWQAEPDRISFPCIRIGLFFAAGGLVGMQSTRGPLPVAIHG